MRLRNEPRRGAPASPTCPATSSSGGAGVDVRRRRRRAGCSTPGTSGAPARAAARSARAAGRRRRPAARPPAPPPSSLNVTARRRPRRRPTSASDPTPRRRAAAGQQPQPAARPRRPPAAVVVGVGEDGAVVAAQQRRPRAPGRRPRRLVRPGATAGSALPPGRAAPRCSTPARRRRGRRPRRRAADVVLAGSRRRCPARPPRVVLNVTAVGARPTTDVRVYPTPAGSSVPAASNLNVGPRADRRQRRASPPSAATARCGCATPPAASHLIVDLAGWFGPVGNGWDISWPQCTRRGADAPAGCRPAAPSPSSASPAARRSPTTSASPRSGRGRRQPARASRRSTSTSTPPASATSADGSRVWAEVCGTGTPTSACGTRTASASRAYALAAAARRCPNGGRPMVWMDVEGPYANGPFWQTGYAGAVARQPRASSRALVDGAARGGLPRSAPTPTAAACRPQQRLARRSWASGGCCRCRTGSSARPTPSPRTICGAGALLQRRPGRDGAGAAGDQPGRGVRRQRALLTLSP